MWKVHLTIAKNLFSSIDNNEEHVMHWESDNVEIMINDEADEVIKKLFDSFKTRYQSIVQSMKDSEFAFNHVHFIQYKYHKKSEL